MTKSAYRSQFTDILTADQATVFVAADLTPDVVGMNDGVVYFGVDDDKGAPLALIETADETVRIWAKKTFDIFQEDASLLTPGSFAQTQETTSDSEQITELGSLETLIS